METNVEKEKELSPMADDELEQVDGGCLGVVGPVFRDLVYRPGQDDTVVTTLPATPGTAQVTQLPNANLGSAGPNPDLTGWPPKGKVQRL